MRFFSLSIIIIFSISGCSLLSHKIEVQTNHPTRYTPDYTIIKEDVQPAYTIIKEDAQEDIIPPVIKNNTKTGNRKLKKLMRKFDDLIFTQINNEVENGEEDMFLDKYIQAELKNYIKDIDKVETLYPNADDEYKRLTKKLKKESTKLYKIIKIKKTEWVEPQIENVISVCNQCHDLYQN